MNNLTKNRCRWCGFISQQSHLWRICPIMGQYVIAVLMLAAIVIALAIFGPTI